MYVPNIVAKIMTKDDHIDYLKSKRSFNQKVWIDKRFFGFGAGSSSKSEAVAG